jgi:cyclophilin family peptidyl-prolyl cis-trans isomerase/HEAT repeat protein
MRTLVLALLIALAPGAAVAQRTQPSDADVTLYARLLAAADQRRADTALVDEALASSALGVRRLATLVIGQNAIAPRRAALLSLLADPDTAVAANAAVSLGQLRDSSAADALGRALARPDGIAAAAAWSLGELGEAGRPQLERVLADGTPIGAIPHVLVAATKLRPLPVSRIAPYTRHASAWIRWSAAYALARNRDTTAAQTLLDMLSRPATAASGAQPSVGRPADGSRVSASETRALVARGLARPAVPTGLADSAFARLASLARDPAPHVRVNAIRSLATYGTRAAPALRQALRDADANVRIALVQALGAESGFAADAWTAAWEADTGFTFRRTLLPLALRAGTRLPPLAVLSRGWARDCDWRRRAAVAEASAATAATAGEIAPLFARDIDGRVRAAAYGALGTYADSSLPAAARDTFRAALRDADLGVRATALGVLARSPRPEELAAILDAYDASRDDRDGDARTAALRYIARLWRTDSNRIDAPSIARLQRLVPPANPLERAGVRGVTPLAVWSAAAGTPRPASWYEDQVRSILLPSLAGRRPRADIVTERGVITLELFGDDAPLTVANFIALARSGFYQSLRFHRVVPNFVVQDGDPRGDGSGGPGYAIRDELNRWGYDRGTLGMALSGPDTGGSQDFLAHAPQPHLDGHYTVFGRVQGGLSVLDAIVQGDRLLTIRVHDAPPSSQTR